MRTLLFPRATPVAGITNQSQHSFLGITGTDSEAYSTESHPGHYSLRSGLELCPACSAAPGLPSLPRHGGGGSARPPRLDHLSFRIVPASWVRVAYCACPSILGWGVAPGCLLWVDRDGGPRLPPSPGHSPTHWLHCECGVKPRGQAQR